MKSLKSIALLSFFSGFVLLCCETDTTFTNENKIIGKLVTHSGCKSSQKSTDTTRNSENDKTCIEYAYNSSTKKLELKHTDAPFNCCPDSLYCVVTKTANTVFVRECEAQPMCNCGCVYDLEIEITGIHAGPYEIIVENPYLSKTSFTVDLSEKKEGSSCDPNVPFPKNTQIPN
jgi:hypothetical protein